MKSEEMSNLKDEIIAVLKTKIPEIESILATGLRVTSLVISGILITSNDHAWGQLVPDNSLGDKSSIVRPDTVANSVTINEVRGGALRGKNLFHSFQEFNINEGKGVYFTNPAGIENIINRVTGSKRSDIQGTLGEALQKHKTLPDDAITLNFVLSASGIVSDNKPSSVMTTVSASSIVPSVTQRFSIGRCRMTPTGIKCT